MHHMANRFLKTICESFSHQVMMLGTEISTEVVYQSQWHTFIDHWKQIYRNISIAGSDTSAPSIALLQYQIYIHGTYIERLIN